MNLTGFQHWKQVSDEISADTYKCVFLILCNERCQHLGDLHNPVNHHFPGARVQGPVKVQGRPRDFILIDYEKFTLLKRNDHSSFLAKFRCSIKGTMIFWKGYLNISSFSKDIFVWGQSFFICFNQNKILQRIDYRSRYEIPGFFIS